MPMGKGKLQGPLVLFEPSLVFRETDPGIFNWRGPSMPSLLELFYSLLPAISYLVHMQAFNLSTVIWILSTFPIRWVYLWGPDPLGPGSGSGIYSITTLTSIWPVNSKDPTTSKTVPTENKNIANSTAFHGTLGGGLTNWKKGVTLSPESLVL